MKYNNNNIIVFRNYLLSEMYVNINIRYLVNKIINEVSPYYFKIFIFLIKNTICGKFKFLKEHNQTSRNF